MTKKTEYKLRLFLFVIPSILFGGFFVFYEIYQDLHVRWIHDRKIVSLMKYQVITDKDTLICDNSFINASFSSKNIFHNLKKGNTYEFKVCGKDNKILEFVKK